MTVISARRSPHAVYSADIVTNPSQSNSKVEKYKGVYEACMDHPNDYALNAAAKYVAALERCRPWVLRNKACGRLFRAQCGFDVWVNALFVSREEAEAVFMSMVQRDEWEIVQWEGSK